MASGISPQASPEERRPQYRSRAGAVSYSDAVEPDAEISEEPTYSLRPARQPKPPNRQIDFDQAHNGITPNWSRICSPGSPPINSINS